MEAGWLDRQQMVKLLVEEVSKRLCKQPQLYGPTAKPQVRDTVVTVPLRKRPIVVALAWPDC